MRKSIHHSFDIDIAEKVGVPEAVLVHHFQYWIELNRKGKRNFHDGKYWTYQTMKNIANTFPYWTERQIERIIGKLIKNKVLIKGNYNKTPFDRTVWYAFYDDDETVKSFSPNGEMEKANGGNGNCHTVKCINKDTDTITNDKPNKSIVRNQKTKSDNATPKASHVQNRAKPSSEPPTDFLFSLKSKKFEGITEDDLAEFSIAYPNIDVKKETTKAELWLKGNPTKAKLKKCWRRFLTRWFSSTDEKEGNKKAYREMNATSSQINIASSTYKSPNDKDWQPPENRKVT